MSEWIDTHDSLPEHGETVLVFRPQVLIEDHTDKPIREASYDVINGCFDCYHQPTKWMAIPKPEDWNEALERRQLGINKRKLRES